METRSGRSVLVAIAFAASGFSALAYQTAWQRVLTQVIGSDSVSAVLTLVLFMVWHGVGSEIARRILPLVGARVGAFYALVEVVIGASAIFSIPVLRSGNAWLATLGTGHVFVDFAFNLVLLAIPVIAMGMTTPLVVEVAKSTLDRLGQTVGRYYGINILGAAIGAFTTGLILIELLGLTGVVTVAAIINVAVGVVIFLAFRQEAFAANRPPASTATFSTRHMIAAVAFGFCTLALQIVFFRVLSNYFTMSTVVFPLVLGVYLLLMSLGQAVGGSLADRFPDRLGATIFVLYAAGAATFVMSMNLPASIAAATGALRFTTFNGQLLDQHAHLIGDPNPAIVLLFAAFFMIGIVAWSALFPIMLRLVTRDIHHAGQQFAALYSFYTIGNVLGAFFAGVVLFGIAGTWGASTAVLMLGCVGTILVLRTGGTNRVPLQLGALGVALVTILATPLNLYSRMAVDRYSVEGVIEGTVGVASVIPTDGFYKIVDMNRTASASALVRDPGPSDQYEAWRWNHTELFALDPEFRPKRVLIIGIGHGYLVDALLDMPFIEEITVVDLSPEIIQAVRANTLTSTKRIFTDPRVKIEVADGRRFIQQALASGTKYDLIQNKINEPWHAGSGNLFTAEFLRTERELLSEGGYLGLRPVLGHVADALTVFERGVWPGYYHMFFKNGELPSLDQATVTEDIREGWYRALPGKPGVTPREGHLDVVVLGDAMNLNNVPRNTDDRPTFEYYNVRQALGASLIERENLWYLGLDSVEVPIVQR